LYTNDLYSSHIVSNTKRFISTLMAAITLTAISISAEAQQTPAPLNLTSQVQESNAVFANGQWQRIEFSKTYDNPTVVVEDFVNAIDTPYVVGVRNVDMQGFEISIKNCDGSNTPIQETVSFLVLDKNSSEANNVQSKQHFSWGECPA
jgi:hypothetical protein